MPPGTVRVVRVGVACPRGASRVGMDSGHGNHGRRPSGCGRCCCRTPCRPACRRDGMPPRETACHPERRHATRDCSNRRLLTVRPNEQASSRVPGRDHAVEFFRDAANCSDVPSSDVCGPITPHVRNRRNRPKRLARRRLPVDCSLTAFASKRRMAAAPGFRCRDIGWIAAGGGGMKQSMSGRSSDREAVSLDARGGCGWPDL